MNRRKFLTISAVTALTLPMGIYAIDFRSEKPNVWTATSVDDGVKALYGNVSLIESDKITLKIPKVVSNGSAVPVSVKSSIDAKTVSLFQNANPESAVAVWSVPEGGIIDYFFKIKLKGGENKVTEVTAIVEAKDGKVYKKTTRVQVSSTTCEG